MTVPVKATLSAVGIIAHNIALRERKHYMNDNEQVASERLKVVDRVWQQVRSWENATLFTVPSVSQVTTYDSLRK